MYDLFNSSEPIQLKQIERVNMCMIKIFIGGRGGGWGGGSSERCFKWGGGRGGSLRDLSKNILKQGVGKGKSCSQGEGVLKVSPLLHSPPPENFNRTPCD